MTVLKNTNTILGLLFKLSNEERKSIEFSSILFKYITSFANIKYYFNLATNSYDVDNNYHIIEFDIVQYDKKIRTSFTALSPTLMSISAGNTDSLGVTDSIKIIMDVNDENILTLYSTYHKSNCTNIFYFNKKNNTIIINGVICDYGCFMETEFQMNTNHDLSILYV